MLYFILGSLHVSSQIQIEIFQQVWYDTSEKCRKQVRWYILHVLDRFLWLFKDRYFVIQDRYENEIDDFFYFIIWMIVSIFISSISICYNLISQIINKCEVIIEICKWCKIFDTILQTNKKKIQIKCKRRHKKLFSRIVLNFFLYCDTFESYFSLLKNPLS